MTRLVSVIIPCRNEVHSIGRCLDSVLASKYPPELVEVIVADGMSDDGTREQVDRYASRHAGIRRIDNPARTTPQGLNHSIAAAKGEFILRLDAHAAIAPDYIARAIQNIESSGADCVGGAMRTLTAGSGNFAVSIRIALSHRFGVGNAHFRTGSAAPRWVDTVFGACWRREVFARIGCFDPRLERSQDIEFSTRLRRAGGRILLSPDMSIAYYARTTLGGFWRQSWSNGVWAILPFAHVSRMAVGWRHLAPLALVLGLVASAAAAWFAGMEWVGSIVAAPYLAANFVASAHAARRERSARLVFVMPIVFASLHLAYGTGSLWGCVRLAALAAKPKPAPALETAP